MNKLVDNYALRQRLMEDIITLVVTIGMLKYLVTMPILLICTTDY